MFQSIFPAKGSWYRGNLHMHTTRSDGRVEPAAAVETYRRNGYDFIALTDHRRPGVTIENGESRIPDDWDGVQGHVLTDLNSARPDSVTAASVTAKDMLILSGVEWDTGGINSDLPGDVPCWHILGIGMTSCVHGESLRIVRHPTPQYIVDTIHADGGIAILAHPCWSVMDPASITKVHGFAAAEIYNAVSENPWNGNRADSSVWFDLWATNQHILMPAVAGDDAHSYSGDQCQSFTMVKAESLTRDGIIAALDKSAFYASQGPVLKDVLLDREKHEIRIDCSDDVVTAVFYSNCIWQENRVMNVLHRGTVTYPIADSEFYIRAELFDRFGRRAWTSPISVR